MKKNYSKKPHVSKKRPFNQGPKPEPTIDWNLPIRLNKFIAMCGSASRRKADELIRDGSVRVNGKTISELGTMVTPSKDTVWVKNKPVRPAQEFVYVMFNKPIHVVTTMVDPEGRPCISDYFQKMRIRLFPVGRLDWDSEGLIILTNDGAFAQKVSHPKYDIAKTYLVKLNGLPSDGELQKLVNGVNIIGGKVSALAVKRMGKRGSDKYDWIKIIISEGRNRQIRQMFEKIGYDVKKLQRIAIGSLRMANLERGKFKILGPEDLAKIMDKPKEIRDDNE